MARSLLRRTRACWRSPRCRVRGASVPGRWCALVGRGAGWSLVGSAHRPYRALPQGQPDAEEERGGGAEEGRAGDGAVDAALWWWFALRCFLFVLPEEEEEEEVEKAAESLLLSATPQYLEILTLFLLPFLLPFLFGVWVLPEECTLWLFLGDDFGHVPKWTQFSRQSSTTLVVISHISV